jgi:hypothetical protein
MLELFAEMELNQEAASYIAQGLRALASCDGLHMRELALIESFERDLGLEPTDPADFKANGGGPLASRQERELFIRSLQLMALADGRMSKREADWIADVSTQLGVDGERREQLALEAKKHLLGALAGVTVFREQAISVGRSLGLTDEDIAEVLGEVPEE